MRKLRLDPDALVVETFRTAAEIAVPGTVHGAGGAAYAYDSGGSDCPNCWSADPCTDIPIETCTCGCDDTGAGVPRAGPDAMALSDCAATSPCTCEPIETCSCAAPGYF